MPSEIFFRRHFAFGEGNGQTFVEYARKRRNSFFGEIGFVYGTRFAGGNRTPVHDVSDGTVYRAEPQTGHSGLRGRSKYRHPPSKTR